jgi:hypothetical protein
MTESYEPDPKSFAAWMVEQQRSVDRHDLRHILQAFEFAAKREFGDEWRSHYYRDLIDIFDRLSVIANQENPTA